MLCAAAQASCTCIAAHESMVHGVRVASFDSLICKPLHAVPAMVSQVID